VCKCARKQEQRWEHAREGIKIARKEILVCNESGEQSVMMMTIKVQVTQLPLSTRERERLCDAQTRRPDNKLTGEIYILSTAHTHAEDFSWALKNDTPTHPTLFENTLTQTPFCTHLSLEGQCIFKASLDTRALDESLAQIGRKSNFTT
jgi:hypothetical protein